MIKRRSFKILAPAKLNITLDVLNRRDDNYHELDMLMIRVSLFDELHIKKSKKIKVVYKNIPTPENDIITRAILAYSELANKKLGLKVAVKKNIPMEAGLGGGSANAAATLRGMQKIYGLLSEESLHKAALIVGADVPYCLHNDPCRAGGVGEKLIFLRVPGKPLWFLLLKPGFGISTGDLFSGLSFPLEHPDTQGALNALIKGDPCSLGGYFKNSLQQAAENKYPEIKTLCKRLMENGALGAAMTGSGSCVFGLFASQADANAAANSFYDIPFRKVCRKIP